MARTSVRGGGVQVEGLAEAINALGRIQPQLRKEAVGVMRDATKAVQVEAQGNIGKGRYRMRTNKGMIGRSTSARGGGVKLRASKYPWAYAAEFGDRVWHVYDRPMREARFRRLVANPHSPPTSTDLFKNRGGWMIQPAIRKLGPKVTEQASKDLYRLFARHLRLRRG